MSDTPANTDAIVTEHLSKAYGPKWVVRDLNLRVPTGSVYGFLGRNGAGKSTTIKMLTGMVPPDSGRSLLLGEDIATLTPDTRARVAYMAEGHPLYGWMSIGEMVRFTRAFHTAWDQTLVDQVLDHFELSRRQKCGRLSRGQQAQVSLALAMAPDPELLILDDPTLGLDTVVRRDFLEVLIQLIQSRGRTILFSSHILGDVERVATRIGVMVDGVLRVDCPTETFRESVRKVVAEFDGEPPEFPGCEGLVSWRRVGIQLELVVVNWTAPQQAVLESLEPRWIDVLELNLEDAFIEYTRGSRRSLPSFARENRHVAGARVEGMA
ncbi:MAG: ABC transporter ATP-binding protein [Planctomycetaceae bacterium]|nr:ABC transporter ATP-binding protein [Planctomycetaceae bacterium]